MLPRMVSCHKSNVSLDGVADETPFRHEVSSGHANQKGDKSDCLTRDIVRVRDSESWS